MDKDVKEGIKNVFIAFAGFATVALIGSSTWANWLVIPATPAVTASFGYLFAKKVDKNKMVKTWGILGLVFGILGYIAI